MAINENTRSKAAKATNKSSDSTSSSSVDNFENSENSQQNMMAMLQSFMKHQETMMKQQAENHEEQMNLIKQDLKKHQETTASEFQNFKSSITSIETSINTISSRLSNVETSTNEKPSSIDTSAINSTINTIQQNLKDHNSKISNLNSDINAANLYFTDHEKSNSTSFSRIEQKIIDDTQKLQLEMRNINNNVNKNNAQLTNLHKTIPNTDTIINNLQKANKNESEKTNKYISVVEQNMQEQLKELQETIHKKLHDISPSLAENIDPDEVIAKLYTSLSTVLKDFITEFNKDSQTTFSEVVKEIKLLHKLIQDYHSTGILSTLANIETNMLKHHAEYQQHQEEERKARENDRKTHEAANKKHDEEHVKRRTDFETSLQMLAEISHHQDKTKEAFEFMYSLKDRWDNLDIDSFSKAIVEGMDEALDKHAEKYYAVKGQGVQESVSTPHSNTIPNSTPTSFTNQVQSPSSYTDPAATPLQSPLRPADISAHYQQNYPNARHPQEHSSSYTNNNNNHASQSHHSYNSNHNSSHNSSSSSQSEYALCIPTNNHKLNPENFGKVLTDKKVILKGINLLHLQEFWDQIRSAYIVSTNSTVKIYPMYKDLTKDDENEGKFKSYILPNSLHPSFNQGDSKYNMFSSSLFTFITQRSIFEENTENIEEISLQLQTLLTECNNNGFLLLRKLIFSFSPQLGGKGQGPKEIINAIDPSSFSSLHDFTLYLVSQTRQLTLLKARVEHHNSIKSIYLTTLYNYSDLRVPLGSFYQEWLRHERLAYEKREEDPLKFTITDINDILRLHKIDTTNFCLDGSCDKILPTPVINKFQGNNNRYNRSYNNYNNNYNNQYQRNNNNYRSRNTRGNKYTYNNGNSYNRQQKSNTCNCCGFTKEEIEALKSSQPCKCCGKTLRELVTLLKDQHDGSAKNCILRHPLFVHDKDVRERILQYNILHGEKPEGFKRSIDTNTGQPKKAIKPVIRTGGFDIPQDNSIDDKSTEGSMHDLLDFLEEGLPDDIAEHQDTELNSSSDNNNDDDNNNLSLPPPTFNSTNFQYENENKFKYEEDNINSTTGIRHPTFRTFKANSSEDQKFSANPNTFSKVDTIVDFRNTV